MTTPAPNIDQRSAGDIARQVQDLIKKYAPGWQEEFNPTTGQATGVGAALVGVFVRFAEIIIQRLNQAPQKNFLAFLNLLGASLLPPQPARVPLTFSLAAGSTVDGLVLAGTQVAAPPAEGETDPVIFETERELTVTAAQLVALFVRDPEQDTYADNSALITSPVALEALVFQGNRRIEHVLYIGHSQLLGFPVIANLRLTFNLTSLPSDTRILQWEVWDGSQWQDKTPPPARDQTKTLQQSGTIEFGALTAVPSSPVNALPNRWLRCRLLTPITQSAAQQAGMERASQLPRIQTIRMTVDLNRTGLPSEAAFTNLLPVDASKDFFPFGEKPKFGDTFWLAQREAFSVAGATITLQITLVNPTGSTLISPPPVKASADLTLRWEVWNGIEWLLMGISTPNGPQAPLANAFADTTRALTIEGQVRFTLPAQVAATPINGVENFWLRVRISSGDYGQEARYVQRPETVPPNPGYDFVAATFAAPAIRSIRVTYALSQGASPEAVQTFNDFVYKDVTLVSNDSIQSFAPFCPTQDPRPTLYLGFTLPPDRPAFPNRTISLFSRTAEFTYGKRTVPLWPDRSTQFDAPASVVTHTFFMSNATPTPATFTFSILGTRWQSTLTPPSPIGVLAEAVLKVEVQVVIPPGSPPGSSDRGFLKIETSTNKGFEYTATFVTFVGAAVVSDERPRLVWEYWNGQRWLAVTVRDDAENFTRPGVVEFLAPLDFTTRREFDQPPRYWLRVRWEKGAYVLAPRLCRMLLNTTTALQTVTIRNEILGSSDGSGGQTFRSTRTPILLGQRLEVREPEVPAAPEREVINKEEGADAITIIPDATGRPREIWVRWHEVTDFYGSRPRARHYVLDHLTGELTFGDGVQGLIPPVGIGNLRLARYQVGGGNAGNKPAGTIVQLKTTVPYVDKVTNTEAAAGGADAETLDSLLVRAPRTIRHSNRAVTVEDYEDLAMLASPEVARARCIPLLNLLADPLATKPPKEPKKLGGTPGEVSVIIVPHSREAKPQPSLELLSRVQDYLEKYTVPTVHVSVVGPLYVRVDVNAQIALVSLEGASAVEQAVQQKLASFLHPLTGGLDGAGWDFGRKPHHSDVYALIEAVPGVDHVRSLVINETEDQNETEDPSRVRTTGRFLVFSGTHRIDLVFGVA